MGAALATLVLFQLVGEVISRAAGLPVPGPVLGFVLLAAALLASPGLRRAVSPTANTLLSHLSLLFVPASVGVVQLLPRLRAEALPITVAVLVSTWAGMAVTALVFRAVAARLGIADEPREGAG